MHEPIPLGAEDGMAFHSSMAGPLRGIVKELAALEDPAELELEAAGLVPALLYSEAPTLLDETIALIEEAPGGYAVLRAMAASGANRGLR